MALNQIERTNVAQANSSTVPPVGTQPGPKAGTHPGAPPANVSADARAAGEAKRKAVGSTRGAAERRFQQGLFAYHRGDFLAAQEEFEKAGEAAAATHDHARFVEVCTYNLRILAEREEFHKIDLVENRILAIMATTDLPSRLKSKAMYVLGICGCYEGTRHEQAMNRFREAIDFAVSGDDKEALAAPLYGAATLLYARQRYDEALRELDRLGILLTCLRLPEIAAASMLLRAMIHRRRGATDLALDAAWKSYDLLKFHPQLILYPHVLCILGSLHQTKGDLAAARIYLDLADRSVKREEFPRIARLIDEALAALGTSHISKMDLVFDSRTGILTERVKGEIRFEGQFVLRDLLKLFLENPGQVFTKEELVRLVWRESYEPRIHDNKIYVTIKRLRALLECQVSKTEYILRAKNGYFLNPKARVLIEGDSKPALSSHLETEI